MKGVGIIVECPHEQLWHCERVQQLISTSACSYNILSDDLFEVYWTHDVFWWCIIHCAVSFLLYFTILKFDGGGRAPLESGCGYGYGS